jgi:hypothetical protein
MITYIFRDINTGETYDVRCHHSRIELLKIIDKELEAWLKGRTVERLEV